MDSGNENDMDVDIDMDVDVDVERVVQGVQDASIDTDQVYTVNECLEMFRTNFHIYRKYLYGVDSHVHNIFNPTFAQSWTSLPHLLFVGHDKSPLSEICQTFIQFIFEQEDVLSSQDTITKTITSFSCRETNHTPVKYYTCPYYIDIPICRYASFARTILSEVICQKMQMRNITYKKHIIMLRGIDAIKPSFQKTYLRMMEKYNKNMLFICTANRTNNVIQPMLSRMMTIRCPLPSTQAIYQCMSKIRRHMSLDVKDEVLNEIAIKSDRDVRSATSMMSSFLMVRDVKLFDSGTLEEMLATLVRKMLRTQIAINMMVDVRKTYYTLAAHNMPFSHICLTVCKYLTQLRPTHASQIVAIVANTDHKSCMGSKALLHFESMMYKLYKLTH